ncbi:MAG: hypothetical protein AB2796_05275 [Candidatus Thiodiazotropha sp.]
MNSNIATRIASHTILAVGTLFVSLAIFEGILSIAVRDGGETEGGAETAVAMPAQDMLPLAEPQHRRAEEKGTREQLCESVFYAVLKSESAAPICVQNPTLRMAQWGPPSAAWFRSVGGSFLAHQKDAAPSDLCACLARQPGYQVSGESFGDSPIDHAVFENIQIPIVKWSCGDACASVPSGDRHEL